MHDALLFTEWARNHAWGEEEGWGEVEGNGGGTQVSAWDGEERAGEEGTGTVRKDRKGLNSLKKEELSLLT